MPSCENEWKIVTTDFGYRWNFYNCIGAMDGKHFKSDPPLQSGSLYYNYKNSFSVVLLAIVDAQLRFMYVDVGTNGRISDTGIWNNCSLKTHLEHNNLNIPKPISLPDTNKEFPFVLIGDEGFPLSTKVLIPYPRDMCGGNRSKRIFNYRLSRARRCSENAFGVLGARFQIFRSAMRYDPDDASKIILACCCIHNMLRTEAVGRHMYTPPAFIDEEDELMYRFQPGEWRQEPALGIINFRNQGGNRHANAALQLRDEWCNYFNAEGAVPWQEHMIDN